MSTSAKGFFVIGFVLTTIGSFLPWRVEGDFLSFYTFGIRIFPSIEDHGGLLILLQSIILAGLMFQRPRFIEQPAVWGIFLSVVLTFVSIFNIIKLMIDRSKASGIIGAPEIRIGLIMVFAGSVILLIASLLHRQKISN